jgi:hypothetical protein
MKRLIIPIGLLALMSFTSAKLYNNYKLSESLNTIQDMKEWMMQDIESGNIDPELGQTYIDNLETVETDLIEYVNANRITN